MGPILLAIAVGATATARAQPPASPCAPDAPGKPSRFVLSGDATGDTRRPSAPSGRRAREASTSKDTGLSTTSLPKPEATTAADVERYLIRDETGECVVARLHGRHGGKVALLQADGQIGVPSTLVPTSEPFVPLTSEALQRRLESGPYKDYKVLTTPHYLVFYRCRQAFAQESAKLLEGLYRGLLDFCRRHDLPAHESEFPLVAVIFANERDFRAYRKVAPEVQAYYEVCPNRIFFYEESERDRNEPKLVALRKPQTVAHEGAHQILANIGIQPRLSDWPAWLVEGFAEYCATPSRTKRGLMYDRLGSINPLHMVTLRELDDPLSEMLVGGESRPGPSSRPVRLLDSASLITKTRLNPTDYAQSWALTHYLTQRCAQEFAKYLREMGRMAPLEPRTPEQHLADFRKFFGDEPSRFDKKVEDHIRKLDLRGNFPSLPYYAVIFERPLGGGVVRRQAWISQSPQVIQRWVEKTVAAQGGMYNWEAVPFPTRARAQLAAENWVRGY